MGPEEVLLESGPGAALAPPGAPALRADPEVPDDESRCVTLSLLGTSRLDGWREGVQTGSLAGITNPRSERRLEALSAAPHGAGAGAGAAVRSYCFV